MLTDAAKQTIWLHHFLYAIEKSEIYKKKIITVYKNNIDFLNLIVNLIFHSRIKHIQIWYHTIQNYIERDKIQIQYVQINEMLADSLIKALNHIKFKWMIKELDLTNWYLITQRNRLKFSKFLFWFFSWFQKRSNV